MNLVFKLLEKVVKVMGDYCDIEVIEVYYCYKVDVLFGIVLFMGEYIVKMLGCDLKIYGVFECNGIIGECKCDEIGFVIICVGDVVGEYFVWFVDEGECVEIVYKVFSCMIFVNGVVCVVKWFESK